MKEFTIDISQEKGLWSSSLGRRPQPLLGSPWEKPEGWLVCIVPTGFGQGAVPSGVVPGPG